MVDKLIKGFTCGAMDVFHAGHVLMMEDCKRHCDYLIVGLHTNPQLDRPDKNKPVQSVVERYIQLRGSKFVDEIIPYETESDLIEILKGIDYDIRFVGDDWKGDPMWIELEKKLAVHNARIEYFKYTEKVSSTKFTEILQSIHDNKEGL